MCVAGTEVTKEASDIVLMDINFTLIVKTIVWGHSVNNTVLGCFIQGGVCPDYCSTALDQHHGYFCHPFRQLLFILDVLVVCCLVDRFMDALALKMVQIQTYRSNHPDNLQITFLKMQVAQGLHISHCLLQQFAC